MKIYKTFPVFLLLFGLFDPWWSSRLFFSSPPHTPHNNKNNHHVNPYDIPFTSPVGVLYFNRNNHNTKPYLINPIKKTTKHTTRFIIHKNLTRLIIPSFQSNCTDVMTPNPFFSKWIEPDPGDSLFINKGKLPRKFTLLPGCISSTKSQWNTCLENKAILFVGHCVSRSFADEVRFLFDRDVPPIKERLNPFPDRWTHQPTNPSSILYSHTQSS
eukprot:PhF_6_TR897/c0_g2_i3/m.1413